MFLHCGSVGWSVVPAPKGLVMLVQFLVKAHVL